MTQGSGFRRRITPAHQHSSHAFDIHGHIHMHVYHRTASNRSFAHCSSCQQPNDHPSSQVWCYMYAQLQFYPSSGTDNCLCAECNVDLISRLLWARRGWIRYGRWGRRWHEHRLQCGRAGRQAVVPGSTGCSTAEEHGYHCWPQAGQPGVQFHEGFARRILSTHLCVMFDPHKCGENSVGASLSWSWVLMVVSELWWRS